MKTTKSSFAFFFVLILGLSLIYIGCSGDNGHEDVMEEAHEESMGDMHEDQRMNMNDEATDDELQVLGEEVMRKGVIDVKSIDEDGDGYVYQDHMDWNVISDEQGLCPICEMKLTRVTIAEAKKNLKEHGFEVKG